MTRKVLKWNVEVNDDPQEIGHGKVVHVQSQHNARTVQVWTEEELGAVGKPTGVRTVRIFGTGHVIPEAAKHLGTTLTPGGHFVWHVYEVL